MSNASVCQFGAWAKGLTKTQTFFQLLRSFLGLWEHLYLITGNPKEPHSFQAGLVGDKV